MQIKFFYIAALSLMVSGCDIGSRTLDSKNLYQCSLAFSMTYVGLTRQNKTNKTELIRAEKLRDLSEKLIAESGDSPAMINQKAKIASQVLLEGDELTEEQQNSFYEDCAKNFAEKA